MRRLLWLSSLALAIALFASGSSSADVFEPIQLVSASTVAPGQQADFARDPAVSGDGSYVAFDGAFDGETGVWRRDLATGVVEKVAGGDAQLPSISEEGRYISFTTSEKLVPEDTNSGPDVYVRDMEVPAEAPGAFTLASAITVNGNTQGLTYEYAAEAGTPRRKQEEEHYGAVAAGRSALSGNGRKVAFVTTVPSDLTGPQTPALQVVVRNLETNQTQLVSVLANPTTGVPELNAEGHDQPVPTLNEEGNIYGAVYPGGALIPEFHPITNEASFAQTSVGASISADGSTVAWMGQAIGEQAKVLAKDLAKSVSYTEPLWRDIEAGQLAPTRRVTGGSDPSSAACEQHLAIGLSPEPSLAEPCQGPFEIKPGIEEGIWTVGVGEEDYLPRLSANGKTVAFISNARDLVGGDEFGALGTSDDLYVVEMEEPTRVLALNRLTEIASGTEDTARTAPVVEFAISPDGTEVAFSTKRTVFPQNIPAFVSTPAAAPGMSELFDVDLRNDTLTRVTHGFSGEGQPAEQPHPEAVNGEDPYRLSQEGSFSPSFSANGNVLAFSSSADNLVYGDGNAADDVFMVDRKTFGSVATEQYISSPPPGPPLAAEWRLGVSALSRSNGSVVLYADVPGSGLLQAGAKGTVLVSSKARKGSHKRQLHALLATVATTKKAVTEEGGLESVTLTLAPRYEALAAQKGGFSANVSVVFSAPGHPDLRQSILVSFLRTVKAKSAKRKATKASKPKASKRGRGVARARSRKS